VSITSLNDDFAINYLYTFYDSLNRSLVVNVNNYKNADANIPHTHTQNSHSIAQLSKHHTGKHNDNSLHHHIFVYFKLTYATMTIRPKLK